jgi:hypothetical protein
LQLLFTPRQIKACRFSSRLVYEHTVQFIGNAVAAWRGFERSRFIFNQTSALFIVTNDWIQGESNMPQTAIAYERNESRNPTLVPSQLAGDNVWYVKVLFPDGHVDHVGVFCDKLETHDWIARNSAAWLADYESRRVDLQQVRNASLGGLSLIPNF